MRPVAIIQHECGVSAGEFERYLRANDIPCETIRIDRGEPVPRSADRFSGVCSLGGSMSVNDPLPWIADETALLRDADHRGRPVIGHCLGGQLLARAFGAKVQKSAIKEIGWADVQPVDAELAREWLGSVPPAVEVFHWHGDVFDLPAGARHLLTSPLAPHQAYVIERPGYAHLGMQFHIEMTPELIVDWTGEPSARREIEAEQRANGGPGVQTPEQMLSDLDAKAERMRQVAARLYARWAFGLAR